MNSVRPLLLLALAAPLSGCAEELAPGPRPRVVLVCLLDTVRADRLTPYGYEIPTTPHLDRLADRGALFEEAQSPAPWTVPSIGSLFTGLYPSEHGAIIEGAGPGMPLPNPSYFGFDEDLPTLAERMRGLGYSTRARIANRLVGISSFEKGFEEIVVEKGTADEIVDWGLERLDAAGARPLFLYLHFMDAHIPLQPPPDVLERFRTEGLDDPVLQEAARWSRYKKVEDLDDPVFRTFQAAKRAMYDAALAYLDEELGRLFQGLEDRGLVAETLIAVTSDHGEEFWDHPEVQRTCYDASLKDYVGCSHGHTLFQELLRVPLILAGPGVPAGQRVGERVRMLDLGATLLELAAGGAAPGLGEARSFVPLLERGEPPVHEFLAESISRGNELKSLIDGDGYKLIRAPHPDERDLLFHLASDPGETTDVAAQHPDRVELLRARLDAQLARLNERRRQGERADAAALEAMHELGYAGDGDEDR